MKKLIFTVAILFYITSFAQEKHDYRRSEYQRKAMVALDGWAITAGRVDTLLRIQKSIVKSNYLLAAQLKRQTRKTDSLKRSQEESLFILRVEREARINAEIRAKQAIVQSAVGERYQKAYEKTIDLLTLIGVFGTVEIPPLWSGLAISVFSTTAATATATLLS